ncbi:uncharacterized protein PG986_000775 [Apiospora aurea]|uniref:Uncharacterized protein n=1 Tax=Apiospora aurea TaxID=335848 RepID=A0ABR1QVN1_9PEZI
MEEPFSPEHLPPGASAISMMMVVEFNFSEAITTFKNTLPGDYTRNKWHLLAALHTSEILVRPVSRRVSAPNSGWETMLAKLPMHWNGHDDRVVDRSYLESASKMTHEDLLQLIGNSGVGYPVPKLSITATLPVTARAADTSPIINRAEVANDDDTLPVGETGSSTGRRKKRKVSTPEAMDTFFMTTNKRA